MKAPIPVSVWHDSGWYYDQSEDSGGHDRIVPVGPFASRNAAEEDAARLFAWPVCFEEGPPLHYIEFNPHEEVTHDPL